jgi:hypothetical protein
VLRCGLVHNKNPAAASLGRCGVLGELARFKFFGNFS